MLFRMIYDDSLAQAAYLIGCQRTGEAIIIDPERDIDRCLRAAEKEGVRIVAVAETHIHADFLSGAREFAERTGARLYLSGEGGPDWDYRWLGKKTGGGAYAHTLLKHSDTFRIGNIEFTALHTPGHTPEHMCFVVTDRGGGADEPMGILTGDFVFVGDVGRPDLLETAAGRVGAAEPAARELFQSLQLFGALPDWLQVWPAHGAGSACGKALGAVPQTTVGYEKRFSPAFRAAKDMGTFLAYTLEGQPDPPLYFARMKRDNRDGPAILRGVPAPKELGVADAPMLKEKGVVVVDTRPWAQFKAGHAPGSIYAPVGANFIPVAGSYLPEGARVCLVCDPTQTDELARRLVRIGIDRVEAFITPTSLAASGAATETSKEIDILEFRRRREAASGEPFVLDVRRAEEHRAARIPGTTNIPHVRLAARLEELPKGRPILVHCLGGGRSSYAVALLQRNGFDATNVAGGFGAWEKSGGEVEHGRC